MAEYEDREHFIPLRKSGLVDLLCSDADLSSEELDLLRQFCRLVAATFHFEYQQRLEELKDASAPFDPAADTRSQLHLSAEEKHHRLDDLFRDFAALMERANFKPLTRDDIQAATQAVSDWGINMRVDFEVFEQLAVFARGDTLGTRTRRRLRNWYGREEVQLPIYQRLVLLLKLRPHHRLGKHADTNSVFIKVFKDIPKVDMEMLLPGARVQMPRFDQGKL